AWHLATVLKKEIQGKPIYRITFNEITKSAIVQSLENPGQIDQNKVDSQQARRILDRIVGYTVSPVLWKILTKDLSAGRVQSVALRLICEREEEIEKFVPTEYWSIDGVFHKGKLPSFKTTLEKWDGKKAEIIDEKKALEMVAALKKGSPILKSIDKSSRKVEPGPSFITSTIQQEASKVLGFPAKKTMKLAQELYEGVEVKGDRVGLISYMRTDSLRISEEAITACRNLISERYGKDQVAAKPRHFANKNNAQDAHEAIRPTDPFRTPEQLATSLSKDQLKLYTLIWQRFVATQMKAMTVATTKVSVELGKALFVATGSHITDEGFKKVYPHVSISEGESIHADYREGDQLEIDNFIPLQHFTKPPARYTEAALIKELESKGIGRPSTYVAILSTIQDRQYVILIAKQFQPTDLGKKVNGFLVQQFDKLFNVKFTAEMENELDDIEYGKQKWEDVLNDYYQVLTDLMGKVNIKETKSNMKEDTDIPCSVCGTGHMQIKWGRKGQFLSCSNFPTCKHLENFTRGADGKIIITPKETLDEACPNCGSPLAIKQGRFGKFIACTNYPKCKYTRPITLEVTCPECGQGKLTEKKSKKGRKFYSCSRYPECKFITNYLPVAVKCPECGNPYMEEHTSKKEGTFKKCPKCGKEVF
ncbi:MAG TPA: type I DNA topoisomerase, partial [Candidatus Cloacimonadota bacterium]|nr:type I DNA topoisomerase [Candidatus Cloacimonadota bacterium]